MTEAENNNPSQESIDSLVVRLGRCVGGKLADDVAKAVLQMKALLDRAIEENSSMTDSTNRAGERIAALERALDLATNPPVAVFPVNESSEERAQ